MGNKRFSLSLILVFLTISFAQNFVYSQDKWLEIKTDNFTVIGNADQKQISKVGIKLEQFRAAIRQLVPELSADSPLSTTVIVFKDNESFHPYKPLNVKGEITDWVAGYFQSGHDQNYIVFSYGRDNDSTFQTIFHEYTHYLIDYNIGRGHLPPWYSEGLAEFYDKLKIEKNQSVKLGGRNDNHLRQLKKDKIIPLKKFFTTDYESLRILDQQKANHFYAQAWVLMHYLMRFNDGFQRAQLDKFIKQILQKKDLEQAFTDSFQMSFGDFENKLQTYIQTSNFAPTTFKLEQKFSFEKANLARSLSEAEVEAYIGDLFYQRERFALAEVHLRKALQIDPTLSFANSTLGLIKLKQKKYEEANQYFVLSNNSNSASSLDHFRYAFFLSREVMSFGNSVSGYSDERAFEMRKSLGRSIELNPNFPDAYQLLAFINLVRNENFDEAIEYLKKAIAISPKNQIYQINLAELFVKHKDLQNGRIIARNVFNNSSDPNLKGRAGEIIDKIIYIERQISEQNLIEKSVAKNTETIYPTSKPQVLTEADLERNRRQTISEKISEVLRRPASGEKRIVGQIAEIVCDKNRVIYTIQASEQTTKLSSQNFEKLQLRTFTAEMRGLNFGCGAEMSKVRAVLTYLPKTENEIAGEIISIEFVPADFVLAIKE